MSESSRPADEAPPPRRPGDDGRRAGDVIAGLIVSVAAIAGFPCLVWFLTVGSRLFGDAAISVLMLSPIVPTLALFIATEIARRRGRTGFAEGLRTALAVLAVFVAVIFGLAVLFPVG